MARVFFIEYLGKALIWSAAGLFGLSVGQTVIFHTVLVAVVVASVIANLDRRWWPLFIAMLVQFAVVALLPGYAFFVMAVCGSIGGWGSALVMKYVAPPPAFGDDPWPSVAHVSRENGGG
jgi:hypothetical protein